ncbi:MAG TPA: SDR family oxidoreductase [Chitinophagaceae bacterium]
MKIIIFGATGSIGQLLVLQALMQGHQVTAFVRDRKKLSDIDHPKLRFAEGNVLDSASVVEHMKTHDAVFCALGAGRKGVVRSVGTKNILEAMQVNGIERFICQTTLGCGESWDNLSFFWKRIMFGWFLKEAFQDHEVQEQLIFKSDLRWTIVRPAAFVKGGVTGNFKHGFSANDKSLKLKISRPDVALFMLDQLNTDRYLRKTPGLSY